MNLERIYPELEAIYAELAQELSRLGPRCEASGRCCRFKESGHELWTTRLELQFLVDREGPPPAAAAREGVCPYLKAGLCSVRDHRMLGCRIYFCDPNYADQMGPLYERYHRKIKDLHRQHGLPYEYAEFLKATRKGIPES